MRLAKTFVEDIRGLILSARATVARGVDLVQVRTNFEIGRRIVEQELLGEDRAAYGKEVLKALSERMTREFGKGFSETNLRLMRLFYLQNQTRIHQSVTDELGGYRKGGLRAGKLAVSKDTGKKSSGNKKARGSLIEEIRQSLTDELNYYDREVKTRDERSTIGIILCKQKNTALVRITLPKDANIHARQYQLYLPSKEELKRKLVEWAADREAVDG